MKGFLHHLFLPRPSNNHRARLLHHSSLLVFILAFFVLQISLGFVRTHSENVLGIQYAISENDLLVMTNAKRQEVGMAPLSLNSSLSEAAKNKAADMYAKNYWAHFAPDGSTSPWTFIKSAGYEYTYAGENLARGYTSSNEVVDAWMASPTHRENMLSKNYSEVGFAIVPGMLAGDDTVLVVEMFGSKPVIKAAQQNDEPIQSDRELDAAPVQQRHVAAVESTPLIDRPSLQKNIIFLFLGGILLLLMVDLFIIRRRQVVRIISHNLDEIIFFGFVLTLVIIIGGGSII